MTSSYPKYEGGLSSLLEGLCEVPASSDRDVLDITMDSREATDGSCFFALEGSFESGADYVTDAISRGATSVVYQKAPADHPSPLIPYLVIPKIRELLGDIANRFFGDPSKSMRIYAVTGTNGKTTVSYLISKALGLLEGTSGYLGTLGKGLSSSRRLVAIPNTTPDIITLNRALRNFLRTGVKSCALEASSIGLSQGRLDSLSIDAALYTNLSHDHLDFHRSFAAYKKAKLSLFQRETVNDVILNIDDEFGRTILNIVRDKKKVFTISTKSEGATNFSPDLFSSEICQKIDSTTFHLHYRGNRYAFETELVGNFNVGNVLLVVGSLLASGYQMYDIQRSLSSLKQVPGRMELCGQSSNGVSVFVDYAHTPDGLKAALSSLRMVSERKISVVFGCGGNRDRAKRPVMGLIAYKGADFIFLTTDNPRGEKAEEIAREVYEGIPNTNNTYTILERKDAIRTAINRSQKGDIVLVAGKGHEAFQEIGSKRFEHDDRFEVEKILAESGGD